MREASIRAALITRSACYEKEHILGSYFTVASDEL
jgi:hypothetical protein